MAKLIEISFDDDDDIEYEPIEVHVPWRNGSKDGVEVLSARPWVPLGVLWRLETESNPAVMAVLIAAALQDDDHDEETLEADSDRGKKGDVVTVAGSASLERWNALIDDFDRRPPNKTIVKTLQALYTEYSNRNNPDLAAVRPTGLSARSSTSSSRTGPSSTGARRPRASTSGASKRRPA